MMKIGGNMKKKYKLKKKVKVLLTFIICITIITSVIVISTTKDTNKKVLTPEQKEIKKMKKIPYYKEKNKKRYLAYQEEKKDLPIEDVVMHVNIGIDKPYYTNTKKATNLNETTLLVNKYYYLTEDYVPENLEEISLSYARSGMQLVHEAKEAFETLSEEAKKEGKNIIAMSSYRSYEYQVDLYNHYVETDGKEAADTYSARAGYSEHQTGLAVDVYNKELPYTSFEQTEEFTWMQENAYKYGFILRFPKDKVNITGYQYESWHYRYVGEEVAEYIHKNDLTLEEYYVKELEN